MVVNASAPQGTTRLEWRMSMAAGWLFVVWLCALGGQAAPCDRRCWRGV